MGLLAAAVAQPPAALLRARHILLLRLQQVQRLAALAQPPAARLPLRRVSRAAPACTDLQPPSSRTPTHSRHHQPTLPTAPAPSAAGGALPSAMPVSAHSLVADDDDDDDEDAGHMARAQPTTRGLMPEEADWDTAARSPLSLSEPVTSASHSDAVVPQVRRSRREDDYVEFKGVVLSHEQKPRYTAVDVAPSDATVPESSVRCFLQASGVLRGESVTVRGYWRYTKKYGWQVVGRPKDLESVTALQRTGIDLSQLSLCTWETDALLEDLATRCKGRRVPSKVFARLKAVAEEQGKSALLALLSGNIQDLQDLPAVGQKTAEALQSSFSDIARSREFQDLLSRMDLHPQALSNCMHYLLSAQISVDEFRADPYGTLLLKSLDAGEASIDISFSAVDVLTQSHLQDCVDEAERQHLRERYIWLRRRAAVRRALRDAEPSGHACLPVEELLKAARAYLEGASGDYPADLENKFLADLEQQNEVVAQLIDETACYYGIDLYRAEQHVANRLLTMAEQQRPPWAALQFKLSSAVTLSPEQERVVQTMVKHQVAVLTGGPGTGKTMVLQAVHEALTANGRKVLLSAPTGRAARRLTETVFGDRHQSIPAAANADPKADTFAAEARTLHWLLMEKDLLEQADVLIIDESSMMDTRLLDRVLSKLPVSAAVYFVGDRDQLPPIGPSHPLRAMIDSGRIPVYRLLEIFRQGKNGRLVQVTSQFNLGKLHSIPTNCRSLALNTDFVFESCKQGDAKTRIRDLVTRELPELLGREIPDFNPARDVQVLVPMRERGLLGAAKINKDLQEVYLTQGILRGESFGVGESIYRGDKVIQLVNDYSLKVSNGDIGTVASVHYDASAESHVVSVNFGPDRPEVVYRSERQLRNLSLAYAITVHKSQGSEFPVVIMPIFWRSHGVMLQRKLVYTAMTRARRMLICIGEESALLAAQNSNDEATVSEIQTKLGATVEPNLKRVWSQFGTWLKTFHAQCVPLASQQSGASSPSEKPSRKRSKKKKAAVDSSMVEDMS